jgi:hypothetical protein
LYLNDPQELQFLRRDLMWYLQGAIQQTGSDPDDYADVLNWLKEQCADVATSAQARPRSGMYVACFSRSPDLLPQWRGYAGGRGYAIGFEVEALSALLALLGHRNSRKSF